VRFVVDVLDHGHRLWPVVDEPLGPRLKLGQAAESLRAQRGHREERDQADHRVRAQRHHGAVRELQHVVIEAVLLVPEALVVERRGDQREVLEELDGHVLVSAIVLR